MARAAVVLISRGWCDERARGGAMGAYKQQMQGNEGIGHRRPGGRADHCLRALGHGRPGTEGGRESSGSGLGWAGLAWWCAACR